MIEETNQQCVYHRVVVGQLISTNDLRILINTVWCHDTGIFMQIIRKPCQQAGTKGNIGKPGLRIEHGINSERRDIDQQAQNGMVIDQSKSCGRQYQYNEPEESAGHISIKRGTCGCQCKQGEKGSKNACVPWIGVFHPCFERRGGKLSIYIEENGKYKKRHRISCIYLRQTH